jgi:predicted MFS family arabinose efflux permease
MAEAFGIHRALDTLGAVIGPVFAFLLLSLTPGAYDSVFVASFFVALVGLGMLALFVSNRPSGASVASVAPASPPRFSEFAGLLRDSAFRRYVVVGGLLSVVTVSDAFIYLTYQRSSGMASRPFPLLYVGTALVYLALAVPLGRVADRIGRAPVFLAGHGLLLGAYAALGHIGPGLAPVLLLLGLLGGYYACTDGVLMAMASAVVPAELRSGGLALVTTVTAAGRFVASIVFGVLWAWLGPQTATTCFLFAMVAALVIAIPTLFSRQKAMTR